ncbi:MAG TPA: peptidase U62, partial [Deltaproteobacteria bacterium]|nr:peptidase U62 [Deltaproteobacteria bacterium]
TGYAYSEDLSLQPMLDAARTAAAIASGSRDVPPQALKHLSVPDQYPIEDPWDTVGVHSKL